jgi:EAL and modified HD-GYP domain-containing signal transduction protein
MSRRPVLDRTLRTVGFEIIFPDGAAGSETWQGELTSDRHPAYLGVTAAYLLDHEPLPLDPKGVVLQLAGNSHVDSRLLDRLRDLRAHGFRVVLDDFSYRAELDPLLACADIVKLDVVRIGQRETLGELESVRDKHVLTLASGVDSEDVFEVFRDAGIDLFRACSTSARTSSPGPRCPSTTAPRSGR